MPYDLNKWILVFVRVGALLSVFPIFSIRNFPNQMRVALAVAITVLVAPLVPDLPVPPTTFSATLILMIKEVGAGVLLGYTARLLFYVLEVAANIITSEIGLNMAAMINPLDSGRSEAPGTILYYLGGILFLCFDMHHWLLLGVYRSFEMVPAGGLHLSAALFHNIVGRTSQLFLVGLLMAAPLIAMSFLINLVFSVLGRAVPQMNVFSESFAFRIASGLVVFSMSFNLISQHVVNYLRRLPADFLRLAQLMGGN